MERIYFDHNATSPLHQRVKEAMIGLMGLPLNPSSVHHYGREARKLLEESREKIRQVLGVNHTHNLVFTSSCTEANNLVLNNFPEYRKVCSAIEHPSVINVIGEGMIPVDTNGIIDLDYLKSYLESYQGTKFVISVMYANNEVGTIQPIKAIKEIALKHGCLLHCDITQAIGRIEADVGGIDIMTFSSHKFGGPIGAGGLIYRKELKINPTILGGGQESRIRSGTQNLVAIHGMAVAFGLIKEIQEDYKQIKKLRDTMERKLAIISDDVVILGLNADRLPNTSSLCMPKVSAETQLIHFDLNGISLSAGSACSSGKIDIPRIQLSMGLNEELAKTAIRVSLGPNNNIFEVDKFVNLWRELFDASR
ncbi:cysteine desulfurase family protein [Candidatus Bandiella euplotis]|uniref:Cysteine desulfurase n=1 Tax=Candidatus Bandiella euplotis TaxID=1664265 RepID=A0ABZ0ULU1_9RICK|nr:cysteine desulfurase family protein [Candidatus Bandiella woodruffii]WPX96694.1 Cysteine desulfurase [Candidatus Bandiella woodruffii]